MSESRYYPKKILDSFKDILFDHFNSEEIKQLIQSSFSVILNDVEKIGKRYPNLFLYFFEEGLLHYLSRKEQRQLIQNNYPVILKYIRKTSNHHPDKFLYLVNAGILDYLLPEIKSQLIQQNYLIFIKNFQKILNPEFADQFEFIYPRSLVVIFEERLFDHLSPEEKTQLILQNFPVLLIFIKRMTRDYATDFLMKMRSMVRKRIPAKTLCYTYLTVINEIEGTKLMDDFFKAILESAYMFNDISSIILKVIDSIKKKQELKQSEFIQVTENENLNEMSHDNWVEIFTSFMNAWKGKRDQELMGWKNHPLYNFSVLPNINCAKCYKLLPPESLLILLQKERVYCPNCGRLVRRKFNPKVRAAYLEELESYIKERKAPIILFFGDKTSRCPMCVAGGRDLKQIDDKSKVLYYASIVPRKETKYVCKKCGYELKI